MQPVHGASWNRKGSTDAHATAGQMALLPHCLQPPVCAFSPVCVANPVLSY